MSANDIDESKSEDAEASGPLLDMSQAAVRKMIATAKARGYITYDELNEFMPPDQVSSEQIEDIMAMLSEMGINVTEGDDAEDEAPQNDEIDEEVSSSRELVAATANGEALDRTDDPVRMYLREMGSVELLSREGEIAIAKRIEAGRDTMIMGLCESPLTFQAITIWRDELLSEDIMLRDVIDLETTFGASLEGDEEETVGVAPAAAPVTDSAEKTAAPKPAASADDSDDEEETTSSTADDDEDDEDEQANMSLAAMEAALKPRVLETLETIANDYSKLADMQDDRMNAAMTEGETFSANQEL